MDDFEVTPAMRAYLAAFDAWLRDRSDERERARGEALSALRACRPSRAVSRRGRALSPREREVLRLRMLGASRPRIAVELGISPRTVAHHFEHIAEKAGTSDPFRLAVLAVKSGLVDPLEP